MPRTLPGFVSSVMGGLLIDFFFFLLLAVRNLFSQKKNKTEQNTNKDIKRIKNEGNQGIKHFLISKLSIVCGDFKIQWIVVLFNP